MRPNNVHDFVMQRVYCTHPLPKSHLSMSAERGGHKFHFIIRYVVCYRNVRIKAVLKEGKAEWQNFCHRQRFLTGRCTR